MKKINVIKINKIWGYEKWLYSPLKKHQSKIINGKMITKGPLIKIIYAKQPLSIQVHPDDKLAKKLENENNGKNECWLILKSSKKSQFVVGLKNYDKSNILKKIKSKTFDDLLIKINPLVGDFINVPAGMVHSVGQESKILEVQQPSDITYRFYDFNRLENNKPRELHIEKSLLALKKLDYKLSPKKTNPLTWSFLNYEIIYCQKSFKTTKESIVIDLNEENAYLFNKGETITFDKFVVVLEV